MKMKKLLTMIIGILFLTMSSGDISSLHVNEKEIPKIYNTRSNDYYSESPNGVISYEDELYMTGTFYTHYYDGDIFLHKYDNNGKIIWGRIWGIPGDMEKECGLRVLVSDGAIFILGKRTQFTNNEGVTDILSTELILLKFDFNGELLWNTTWKLNNFSEVSSFVKFQENIFITGSIGYDALILKFDTNGNYIWNNTWKREGYANSGAEIIVYDEIINIIGNSIINEPINSDIIFLKYDLNGNILFNTTYTPEFNSVSSIKLIGESIYYIGTSAKQDDFIDTKSTSLFRFDLNGNLIWNKSIQYDFDSIAGIDCLDDYFFVAGNIDSDIVILKINADGIVCESETWNTIVYSEAFDITSVNDSIYIIGDTINFNDTNGHDIIFFKYNIDLVLVWYLTWGRDGGDYLFTQSAIVNISMVKSVFTPDESINVIVNIINNGTIDICYSPRYLIYILECNGTVTELFSPDVIINETISPGGVFTETIDLREYSSDIDTREVIGNLGVGNYSLYAVYRGINNPWYNETNFPYNMSTSNVLQFEIMDNSDENSNWTIFLIISIIILLTTVSPLVWFNHRRRQKI